MHRDRLAGFGGQQNGFFVQVIGQANDDRIHFRVADGFRHVRRRARNAKMLGEFGDLIRAAGADPLHFIPAAISQQTHHIKTTNETSAEHGNFVLG